MNQAENEAFENWAEIMNMGGTNFGMLKIDGLYADTRTSLAWAAWVASAINSHPEFPDNSFDNTASGSGGDLRLVPICPTDEMIVAALELHGEDALAAKAPALVSALVKIYVSMVKASPLEAAKAQP